MIKGKIRFFSVCVKKTSFSFRLKKIKKKYHHIEFGVENRCKCDEQYIFFITIKYKKIICQILIQEIHVQK